MLLLLLYYLILCCYYYYYYIIMLQLWISWLIHKYIIKYIEIYKICPKQPLKWVVYRWINNNVGLFKKNCD